MNTSTETTKPTETSLTRDWVNLARYHLGRYLGGRRGLIIVTVAVLAIAGALNWGWLVAIGIAPLLIAIAPCAVMCALGLCMSRMGGQSCSTQSPTAREDADVRPPSSALNAEAPTERVVDASDRHANTLPVGRVGDGEERPAALTRSETTSERS